MANDKIHFLTGEFAKLPIDKLVSGQVYFAVDPQNTSNRGYIYFDTTVLDASTNKGSVKRFLMGSPYADAWTSAKSFGITDGEHQTETTDLIAVDGSQDAYYLHLPKSLNVDNIQISKQAYFKKTSSDVQLLGEIDNNNYGTKKLWRVKSQDIAPNNSGDIEFAVNGNFPIYIRQYNSDFNNVIKTLTLLDANGNTTIPGVLTVQSRATIGSNLSVGGNLSVAGNTVLDSNLAVKGTASITNTLTLGDRLIVGSNEDSLNSTDDAALTVTGGASIGKQLSAKSIRIDNNQISKGCTLNFDATYNCVEFVFD